jgi:hypothetical protein
MFMMKNVNGFYKRLMIEQKLSERSLCVYLFSFATSMVNKNENEGKEPTRCNKLCSFIASTCFRHRYGHHQGTVNAYLPLLGGHTWKPAWGVPH